VSRHEERWTRAHQRARADKAAGRWPEKSLRFRNEKGGVTTDEGPSANDATASLPASGQPKCEASGEPARHPSAPALERLVRYVESL
jgi:hypothetical protein